MSNQNNQNNPNQKSGQDQQEQQRLREQQQQRQSGQSTGRVDLGQVKPHMEVVGSDGAHVGTVDRVDGERIKLTKGENAGGHGEHHHYIAASSIQAIEGNKLRLSMAGKAAIQQEKSGESAGGRKA